MDILLNMKCLLALCLSFTAIEAFRGLPNQQQEHALIDQTAPGRTIRSPSGRVDQQPSSVENHPDQKVPDEVYPSKGSELNPTVDSDNFVQTDVTAPPPENWQLGKTLPECLYYLFQHELATDITIHVSYAKDPTRGGSLSVRAHRLLLSARSPVLAALLQAEPSPDIINVTDAEPEAFSEMLRYIYTDHAHITADNVLFILEAEEAYQLPALKAKCSQFLEKQLTPYNAAAILKNSLVFSENNLTLKATKIIEHFTSAVLTSDAFLDTSEATVREILLMSRLNIPEVELFSACRNWAERRCAREEVEVSIVSVRGVLKDLLPLIHFAAMPIKQFADVVVPSELLTIEEGYLVYQQLTCSDPPARGPFPTTQRQFEASPIDIINTGPVTTTRYRGKYEAIYQITGSSTRKVKLHKLFVHYPDDNNIVAEYNMSFTQNGTTKTIDLSRKALKEKDELIAALNVTGMIIDSGSFLMEFRFSMSCDYRHRSWDLILNRIGDPVILLHKYVKISLTSENAIPIAGIQIDLI